MTKKGFTLMELLVSIFITGMVMLSLLAMWKTSSNHTSQAQRQSIIKNDNTIFLRKFYSDFMLASQVICPWGYSAESPCIAAYNNEYYALNYAKISTNDFTKIERITSPVCDGAFADVENKDTIGERCIRPSYVSYAYLSGEGVANPGIYRCRRNFLDGEDASVSISEFLQEAHEECWIDLSNLEFIMPYVSEFSLTVPSVSDVIHPEALLLNYTVNRAFAGNIPPVIFPFRRYFIRNKGV